MVFRPLFTLNNQGPCFIAQMRPYSLEQLWQTIKMVQVKRLDKWRMGSRYNSMNS